MPSSDIKQIFPIFDVLQTAKPESILDIGPGYGKLGVLCREYLDVSPQFLTETQYPPPQHLTLDCIEIFEDYISPLHRHIYDHIYIGNALTILPTLKNEAYDMALVVDVLEHFSTPDAVRLIASVLQKSKMALVATPRIGWTQLEVFGNAFEEHLTVWTKRKLKKLAPACWFFQNAGTWPIAHMCLLSRDVTALNTLVGKFNRARRMRTWLTYRTALLELLRIRQPLRHLKHCWHRKRNPNQGGSF
jgi:hypothetical protein